MALLIALDDGSPESGETWRVRDVRHVIGRRIGQTIISHDVKMSSEHAAINRELVDGRYVWSLIDSGSTNGTFLRVHEAVIADRCQLLLGGKRYVFHLESDASDCAADSHAPRDGTPAPQLYLGPALDGQIGNVVAECGPEGIGRQYSIKAPVAWIGSARSQCHVTIAEDPFVCPRHACVRRDRQRRWTIQDAKSVNGVWIRVHRARLVGDSEFQLGEQRFLLRFLPEREAK